MSTLPRIGLYEKALPADLDWPARLDAAQSAGFDFVEMSVDETDERLARVAWTADEKRAFRQAIDATGVPVLSMCLSGHRRFPFGSADPAVRQKARDLMRGAIELAADTGIRTIQLAGYDVYYEPSTPDSLKRFEEGLSWAATIAAPAQIMLAMEIMDTPLMGSITKWLYYAQKIPSPWFQVYPDIGNLSAWGNNVPVELAKAAGRIVAIHLKDTLAVGPDFPGKFKEVPFGAGCVDFVNAFRALKAIDYRGAFLIEMWTGKNADALGEVARARQWILDRMDEGDFLRP